MSKDNKIKQARDEAQTIIRNFVDLIEAIAVVTTAGFAIYGAREFGQGKYWMYPVLISGAIVAVIGGLQFVKYLNKKG